MNLLPRKYKLTLADIGYQFNLHLRRGKSAFYRSHMKSLAGVSHRESQLVQSALRDSKDEI